MAWRGEYHSFILLLLARLTVLQDALVAKVASVNSNTIVVVNSVGPIVMEPWIDNVNGE